MSTIPRPLDGHMADLSIADTPGTEPVERDGVIIPSLTDLLRVAREERSQGIFLRRKLADATRLHVNLAEQRRLTFQAREHKQLLVQCIRSENKQAFTTLYHAIEEAYTPETYEDVSGWFTGLAPASQASLLTFLERLCYDGSFLGTQLAAMPQKDIMALLPEDRESVFGVKEGFAIDRALENLAGASTSLESLVLLLHGDLSTVATDVWATACAKLICDQRSVYERVVVHLINMWADSRPNLDLWFAETLQKGSFLKKPTFRQRVHHADDAREIFFDHALGELLELVLNELPTGVLRFCSAIRAKLAHSPKHYGTFPIFVTTRWLFVSFLPKLLTSPESFGILTDHHVTKDTSTRIFKELCDRAMRVAFEVAYPWRHQTQIQSDHAKHVRAIIAAFSKSNDDTMSTPRMSAPLEPTAVAISGEHMLSVVKTFSPRKPDSIMTLQSGIHSSASSISGFSLFRKDSGAPLEEIVETSDDSIFEMKHELVLLREDLEDVLSTPNTWSLLILNDRERRVTNGHPVLPSNSWVDRLIDLISVGDASPTLHTKQQLESATVGAISTAQRQGDHVLAYTLADLLQTLRIAPADQLPTLFADVELKLQSSLQSGQAIMYDLTAAVSVADGQLAHLRRAARHDALLLKELRIKMWYSAVVRSSATFERLQSTVEALRAMESQSRGNARMSHQIVDLLSAPQQHGGPTKLSTDQSKIIRRWLDQNQIYVLCTEERIHKFCMDLRQSVEALTNPSPTENPMLWMDSLFLDDKPKRTLRLPRSPVSQSSFWSPTGTVSSATSISLIPPKPHPLYCSILTLSLSDLVMFPRGSETDKAMWTGIAQEIPLHVDPLDWGAFDYGSAMLHMMKSFSTTPDPRKKLDVLQSIQRLLKPDYQDSWVAVLAEFHPPTLIRDVQYIASLLPQSVLESHDVFWNVSVAITRIKQKLVKSMLETADEIIAYHTNNRRHRPSVAQQERDAAFTHPPNEMSYTLNDAAVLLQTAAKEGNPTAQRELATLYLTHPDLMRPVIAPLTPPKEVFRQELQWQDKQRCDPLIMCVAHHWMVLSSNGGDVLAKEFIKQQEEMSSL